MLSEPGAITAFREWLKSKGGYIHPCLRFVKGESGMSVYTNEEIPPDTTVVSSPFSLAITPALAKHALSTFAKLSTGSAPALERLSERELTCTYLVMHWILEEDGEELNSKSVTVFEHLPYLHTLPPPSALRTSLYFNETEIDFLRGTNMFGATIDRKAEREIEWSRCRDFVGAIRRDWTDRFTWQRYLTAATYLSSRAFPSTLLSENPSLVSTDSSYPVLFPGLDAFNHARARRVSWITSGRPTSSVSLVAHPSMPANTEVFNNYGPKPNAELILGYGFTLPSNPDDTILLKIGGRDEMPGARWEIRRDARGADGLWGELKALIESGSEDDEEIAEWEVEMESSETLKEMVESKLAGLPVLLEERPDGVREDVWSMIQHYVAGQTDILLSLSVFAAKKRESALEKAKVDGVELIYEDESDTA